MRGLRTWLTACISFVGVSAPAWGWSQSFTTSWGEYMLSSPTEESVAVTTDGGATMCNTTCHSAGYKLTTLVPPNENGDYTVALTFSKATLVPGATYPNQGWAAAKYAEKDSDALNWTALPLDIGSVYGDEGGALNGYLASDGFGNVYLAFQDKNGTLGAEGTRDGYVIKKDYVTGWGAPERVFREFHLYSQPDWSGYDISSAYGTEDTLGIISFLSMYPTGRQRTAWINAKSQGPWLHPIKSHGLELQGRMIYGGSGTMAEDGTYYSIYNTYQPEALCGGWYTPQLPQPQPGSGVTAVGGSSLAPRAYDFGTYPVGSMSNTSCAPYATGFNPLWHTAWCYGSGINYHYWAALPLSTDPAWSGYCSIRTGLTTYRYYTPNMATYYDAEHGITYMVYAYVVSAPVGTDGRVYLDITRFDPSASPADELVFTGLVPNNCGLEVAPRRRNHCFYPQVTVDKGNDEDFDVIVAWTECNTAVVGKDGLYYPVDGDVYYRQFTLDFLGSD